MVEGFDPLNEKFPEIYYNLTWNLVNTDLYPNGYEVFILNFSNGGRDLRLNAEVLLKAIEKVHEVCPNFKIALAGLSMGGPIGRYALAKKETQGGTHNIGLFLSYDSPQHWAHVNPFLQDWIKQQNPNEGAIGVMQANLQSVGAKQMLGYNTYDPSHTFRDQFFNELNSFNGDGYPHQSYNVSVSNGNFNATWGNESIGRHLLTLKISDYLLTEVPAVEFDCETGSMITNITTRRYGDIYPLPWLPVISIPYSMEIIFNPAYTPTWSSLDLVDWHDDSFGNITSFDHSKFDDFVVQPVPLQHHVLSSLTRNKIMEWLNKTSNITVNYSLQEGGSVTPDNYQVRILHGIPITVNPKTVNVNGKQINYTFLKWSDGNTDNPRTFYGANDATVTAVMKGANVSEDPLAFSTNSQRKFVKTDDGWLHKVYESMGHVWYETSSDNGVTWTINNNGKPLDNGEGKLPSITYSKKVVVPQAGITWNFYQTFIVFQEKSGSGYKIKVNYFHHFVCAGCGDDPPPQSPVRTEAELGSGDNYSIDAAPVIGAYKNSVGYNYFTAVWKNSGGLYARSGGLNMDSVNDPFIFLNTGNYITTSTYAINPSISYSASTYNKSELAWEENNQIKYASLNGSQVSGSITTPSSNSGFGYNNKPSIIEIGGSARLIWSARYYAVMQPVLVYMSTTNYSYFRNFGSNISSPNINKSNDNTYFAFAWSEGGTTTKFADNSLSTIRNLNTTGKDIQISNGPNKNGMYGNVFNAGTSPYYFTITPNLGTYYQPQKITSLALGRGRQGTIIKNEAGFYFAFGDISIDGSAVDFVEVPDTAGFSTKEELNQYLLSEPFSVNDNCEFLYSVHFGVTDSASAVSLLGENGFASFKVALIDNVSGEVLGLFDNVVFSGSNIVEYNSISYQVNTSGIGNRIVRLRLSVDNNLTPQYSLTDKYADESVLPKKSFNSITYKGALTVENYDLAQNYPNPFNPETIISFKTARQSFISLKIFDILGNEIKTLVNEVKSAGNYKIKFHAEDLASGIYYYQLKAEDYLLTKKMILLR